MTSTSPVTLFDLPNELLLEIMRSLGYASHLYLSQSCSFFRTRVAGLTPPTLHQKLSYLREVKVWPKNIKYFSCYSCLKLRPQRRFDDKQVQQEREKGGSESDHRFCVDCGIKSGIYRMYSIINIEGLIYPVCRRICNNICGLGFDCGICHIGHLCFEIWRCLIPDHAHTTSPRQFSPRNGCPYCLELGHTCEAT